MYSDVLLYDRNIIGLSSEIFGYLRRSSLIFGKCSKTFVKLSEQFWEIFGKWSEIFGKSSKTSLLVCLYNKQNITCALVRSLVRYRVEHEKIKFISTRRHVISSMYTRLTRSEKSQNYSHAIVFGKLRFQNVFHLQENKGPVFSNSSGLKSLSEKFRFRDGLVWTVGPTVEMKLLLKIFRRSAHAS